MNIEELMAKAWAAVQKSGIPDSLHEVAFKEAVDYLRAEESGANGRDSGAERSGSSSETPKAKTKRSRSKPELAQPAETVSIDKEEFFSRLVHETDVPDQDLRDILELGGGGAVHVTVATKDHGDSRSEQARTVVALVAGARHAGLGEDPINGTVVREEVKRKRCFDTNNYSAKALGQLKGFNPGGQRNQIVTTSKWVEDFKAAVDQAHGRTNDTPA